GALRASICHSRIIDFRHQPSQRGLAATKVSTISRLRHKKTGWRLSRMIIELINTGSELLLGRVLNTHQQWLCRRLADLGYVVTRQVAVPDTAVDIENAVREALARADLIITTGGLGPTSDDITRELIAKLL